MSNNEQPIRDLDWLVKVLLLQGDKTGYEIARSIAGTCGNSHQQVYRVLNRMNDKGEVTFELVPQEGKPDKKVYKLVTPVEFYISDVPASDFRKTPASYHYSAVRNASGEVVQPSYVRHMAYAEKEFELNYFTERNTLFPAKLADMCNKLKEKDLLEVLECDGVKSDMAFKLTSPDIHSVFAPVNVYQDGVPVGVRKRLVFEQSGLKASVVLLNTDNHIVMSIPVEQLNLQQTLAIQSEIMNELLRTVNLNFNMH